MLSENAKLNFDRQQKLNTHSENKRRKTMINQYKIPYAHYLNTQLDLFNT